MRLLIVSSLLAVQEAVPVSSQAASSMQVAVLSLALAAVASAAPQVAPASAMVFPKCPSNESYLMVRVISTDKLTKCRDIFDKPDPYAVVTVGPERYGMTKITRTLDNKDRPVWDEIMEFGCTPINKRISFKVGPRGCAVISVLAVLRPGLSD
jgi:hypothetical protein